MYKMKYNKQVEEEIMNIVLTMTIRYKLQS